MTARCGSTWGTATRVSGRGAWNISDEEKDAKGVKETYRPKTRSGGTGIGNAAKIAATTKGAGDNRNFGLKPKDLIGIPWRVAFALQADGWYLRQDIIWHKPNPMPESVRDRCTKAHEYVFLLSKSERYFYDADAIAENATADHPPGNTSHKGAAAYDAGAGEHRTKAGLVAYAERQRDVPRGRGGKNAFRGQGHFRQTEAGPANRDGRDMANVGVGETRNKRDVWTIATKPYAEAHFATMAPELAETCIRAGCAVGGTVLDPFGGAGTTALVADQLQRSAILIELNPDYAAMAGDRITGAVPLFAEVAS